MRVTTETLVGLGLPIRDVKEYRIVEHTETENFFLVVGRVSRGVELMELETEETVIWDELCTDFVERSFRVIIGVPQKDIGEK